MTDDEFPSDLVEAQRAYWEVDARVREAPAPRLVKGISGQFWTVP
ncbi:hypothetical protein GCM10017673_56220 [Streptosporangium violaceochromogenes]|nr:hypothetical protein GCM10017673_56220 [Streptosporangium violaceochromogenes]